MLNVTILIWKVIRHARNILHILDHIEITVQNIIVLLYVCGIPLCHNLIIAEPTFNYWPWKFLIHYYNYEWKQETSDEKYHRKMLTSVMTGNSVWNGSRELPTI